MTTPAPAAEPAPIPKPDSPLRRAVGAIAGAALVTFMVASANAILLSRSDLLDVQLPMLGLGLVLSAPGWLILVLAARIRGAPGRWLSVTAAWGFFAAPFLSLIAEDRLSGLVPLILNALAPFGRGIAEIGPETIIGPLVEEPAKALGVLIVLIAIRRAGTAVTPALGAVVGALAGLGFSLTEISHRLGDLVVNTGYFDRNGVFVIDRDAVWHLELLQLVNRLFLAGLSDHAVFSALAGVAIVQLLRGRPLAAAWWFLASLTSHALSNSVGVSVGQWTFGALGASAVGNPGLAVTLAAVWLAAFAGFVVSQGWAVILLARAAGRFRR